MKGLLKRVKAIMNNEYINFTVKMTIITIVSLLWVSVIEAQRVDKQFKYHLDRYIEILENNDITVPENQYMIYSSRKLYNTHLVGVARGMFTPMFVHIIISPTFSYLDYEKRAWVIYHELTHDIFNIRHGEIDLMEKVIPEYLNDMRLNRAMKELVRYLKDGYDWTRLMSDQRTLERLKKL